MRSAWLTIALSLVTSMFVFLPMAYGLRRALPHNPVSLPVGNFTFSPTYFPQGWSFFTRDAREPRIFVFQEVDAQWKSANSGSGLVPKFWFGLDRTARAQGIEIGLLMSDLSKDVWRECRSEPKDCFDSQPTLFETTNKTPSPTVCGRIGIALTPPVPWVWARRSDAITMPSRTLVGDVKCSR